MKKEDKISLAFLVIFALGLLNLIINLAVKLGMRLSIAQSRILFLAVFLFALALILSSKEKILKNKFYSYFKKQVLLFLQTFKEWKVLIRGVIIDALALFSIFLLIFLALKFIKWNFSFMEQIPGFLAATQSHLETGAKAVDSALQQELQKTAPNIKSALIFSGVGLIAAYLLIILSIGFFQGLLYSKFTGQKFDKIYLRKFLILSFILILSFTLLVILTGVMIKNKIAAYIIVFSLFLFFYLALILFSLTDKKEKILRIIKSSLNLAFKKIYLFFTPFVIAYTLITILFLIMGFLQAKLALLPLAAAIIYISIIIIFIAWLKFFIVKIMESIKNG